MEIPFYNSSGRAAPGWQSWTASVRAQQQALQQAVDEVVDRRPGKAGLVDPQRHQPVQARPGQRGHLLALAVRDAARGDGSEQAAPAPNVFGNQPNDIISSCF